ncbi:MAG: guanylate kinase [Gammaproteobacteria bacterium]|nr:guanylate kinase [Gammaproteobacteria bacterium]NIN62376.1 guanylate kinase [Gammaproteobacteria bacterium]NIO61430.1 guanylate kinase [Gammaproteobacteria bacterium]NIP49855.1 guanylate kinase [Gammaproteobacteria bacterium]NIQ11888.1 guanylate kinase [Gammaproteobacteria bacterium]
MPGTLFIISAASGTGKTTLVRKLCAEVPDLQVSISYTTRPQRTGEVEGVDYFFVSEERFSEMVNENAFLEHEIVFSYRYGTPRAWVESQMNNGKDIILEIDWQGARDIKALFPDCVSIFILPPSLEELEKRLRLRKREDAATIQERLDAALEEISHYELFDYLVMNDCLEKALAELTDLIRSTRKNERYRGPDHLDLARQLMTEGDDIQ